MRYIMTAALALLLALALPAMAAADNHTVETNSSVETNTSVDSNTTVETNQTESETELETDAGIAPGNVFYGIDVALDRIAVALERNPEKRAEKAMRVAEERLQEVRLMLENQRAERAERAAEQYNKSMTRAERAIERINGENATTSMRAAARLRAQAQNHTVAVLDVHQAILERQKDRMSEEQIAHLESVFARIALRAEEVDAKVELKKEQARTRAKAQGNLSEAEAAELELQIDNQTGLTAALEARKSRIMERIAGLENGTDQRADVARENFRMALDKQLERVDEQTERARARAERAENPQRERNTIGVNGSARARFAEDLETEADADVEVSGIGVNAQATGRGRAR